MTARGAGILAVWNDCDPANEGDYERWYVEEHLPERVGLPGFRFGRRFEAVEARAQYFTYYETDSPAVLFTAAYLARLDDPTPRTRAVMPSFWNQVRTVFREEARYGRHSGGFAVSLRPAEPLPAALAADLGGADDVLCVRQWQAVEGGGRIDSVEAGFRTGRDIVVEQALVVELAREAPARQVLDRLKSVPGEIGLYRYLCGLDHDEAGAEGQR